jgi:hypothetical protein
MALQYGMLKLLSMDQTHAHPMVGQKNEKHPVKKYVCSVSTSVISWKRGFRWSAPLEVKNYENREKSRLISRV